MKEVHSFRFEAMNTEFEIRVPKDCLPFDQAKTLSVEVIERVEYIEDRLSRFIPSSDISNINHLEPGDHHILDPYTFDCLNKAIQAHRLTDGYFSVQAGRFDEELQLGLGAYLMHEKDEAISCLEKGRSFDMGGVGKGYALDCLTDIFEYWEVADYYVSAGNSTILVRNKSLPSWDLKISHSYHHQLELTNATVSGSGDRKNTQHIRRPNSTNRANESIVPTWVQCESAAFSDAFSTACSLMNTEQIQKTIDLAPFNLSVFQERQGKLLKFNKTEL